MPKEKKLSLEELIEKTDAAKKKNPLDLSSDQDLSIALMNLISLEEHFFFSGAKTKKTGYYDLIQVVRDMRGELMKRIVDQNGHEGAEVWCISKHLLAACMRLKEVGDKANGAGNKEDAHHLFEKAYDLYSLFWGINMGLIDLTGVQKIDDALPRGLDIWVKDKIADSKEQRANKTTPSILPANKRDKIDTPPKEGNTLTARLGNWVKNMVNCCIE
ncbi:MAG: hypothetical protein FWC61_03650, partial [Proteobacteria bacterium]|nr:hypothetical protein [Pseudomonadota bacterium]